MKQIDQVPVEWWQRQAWEDLLTAKACLSAKRYYAAAFFSHQVAEKSLKAAISRSGRNIPYTHDIKRLASLCDLPDQVHEAVSELAPEYGRAKCPFHAGGVPALLHNQQSARLCIRKAEIVLDWSRRQAQQSADQSDSELDI